MNKYFLRDFEYLMHYYNLIYYSPNINIPIILTTPTNSHSRFVNLYVYFYGNLQCGNLAKKDF